MGWQADIFERLRDREWHHLGELFEMVETEIPLHHAMRAAMQESRGRTEMPNIYTARWDKFRLVLSSIGVETSGNSKRRKLNDQVRLRYVPGRTCAQCAGPVIKATWTARRDVVCLHCNPPVLASFTAAPVSREEPAAQKHHRQPAASATPPSAAGTLILQSKLIRIRAKIIRSQYRLWNLSINEIARQLRRWSEVDIVNRYRSSFINARPRPPPASEWLKRTAEGLRDALCRKASWAWLYRYRWRRAVAAAARSRETLAERLRVGLRWLWARAISAGPAGSPYRQRRSRARASSKIQNERYRRSAPRPLEHNRPRTGRMAKARGDTFTANQESRAWRAKRYRNLESR